MNFIAVGKRLASILYLRIEDGLYERSLIDISIDQNKNVRRLQKGDIALIASNFSQVKADEFAMRLEEADGLIYEPTPGVIAGYGWATVGSRAKEGDKPFFYSIEPQNGELYIFDVFVKPDHRGQGVASVIMKAILELGQQKGLKRCFTLHDVKNSAMIKASEHAGLRRSGIVSYQRIGPWVKQDIAALSHRTS